VEIGNQPPPTNVRYVATAQRRTQMVTPQAIENRLANLSREVDESHQFLNDAEVAFHAAKATYEIAMATSRLSFAGDKLRVQDVQDIALRDNAHLYRALNTAEATVKAARANAQRIRTQVDIARSIGTSVRASLEM
jgi:nitric oxide synthase oxygenase domain/subunit